MKFKAMYLGFAVFLVNHGLYGMEQTELKGNFKLLNEIKIQKPQLENKDQNVAPINEPGITIPITNFQPDGLFYQTQYGNQMNALYITKELNTQEIKFTNIPVNYFIGNVGYSPDENYVAYTATFCENQKPTKMLVIMNTKSQEVINKIENPFGSPEVSTISLMFSPDSKKLVASSYGALIKIFDVTTMKSVDLVTEDARWVSSCFNRNFTLLVAGDEDGYLTIFNLETNEKIERYKAHDQLIARVQFSPDGAYFATGSFDNSIKIWETPDNPKLLRHIPNAANQVSVVAWNPNGKYVASGSWADGDLTDDFNKIWNIDTGVCIQEMQVITPTFDIQWSNDAKHLMTSQGWPLTSVSFWEGNITGDESN
jgi:WD40 repeat protein